MTEKKALGKGLGALIGEGRSALGRAGGAGGEGRLRELPLAEIAVNRRQPRRVFAADELEELAASIKALGVVQPIVVRPLQTAAPAAADRRRTARSGRRSARLCRPVRASLRAHRRRAPAARRQAGRPRVHPGAGAPGRRDRVARDRPRRERRPRGPQQHRGGAGLRVARRRVRAHARARRRAGRPQSRCGHNLLRLLELPDERAADDRAGRAERGAWARAAGAARPRAAPQGGAPRRLAGPLGAADRGAGEEAQRGGAGRGRACGAPARRRRLQRPRRRALRPAGDAGAHPQRQARRHHPDRLQEQSASWSAWSACCGRSETEAAGRLIRARRGSGRSPTGGVSRLA